jgi:hypothetical protein
MRVMLYHESAQSGKIFEDEAEIKAKKKEGWVEAPWLVGQEVPTWDPVKADPQKRYEREQIEIMTDWLDDRKIKFSQNATGIELHKLILEKSLKK